MNKLATEINYTLDTIESAATHLMELAKTYHVLAFSGEMGAGKTTLIHALCAKMGVADRVSSPTFALVNEYHFTDTDGQDQIIYHMDWYRLKDAAEAINAGMGDCLDQANDNVLCFIEWPEQAIELLQPPYLWVKIHTLSISERRVEVTLVSRTTPKSLL